MVSPADIQALGYEVTDAGNGNYFIRGYGVASYFAAADLKQFANPDVHAERVKQFEEGPPAPSQAVSPGPLDEAIDALSTLDQSKPATIGDVVAALKTISV